MATPRRVFVVGVGMTKFEKPGRRQDFDYPQMGLEAGLKALKDAGISYDEVQQACVGYVFGDSTCGQRTVYQLGLNGIPVYNVNNACSTGSTALMMARQFVEGGLSDCVLAMGFEKMERGSIKGKYKDRTSPMDNVLRIMKDTRGITSAPVNPQMFGNAGLEHMEKYGTKPEHFAKIAYKNHKHSVNNPNAQFQQEYTLEQVMNSRMISDPLTLLQCSPTSDGGAAAIVVSEDFVKSHNLEKQAVEIVAQTMTTDTADSFDKSDMNLVGYGMTKRGADYIYKKAGIKPDDVDVIELHDCFSTNELITYEALGLCEEGKAGEFIDRGDNTYGGKFVINPSGGLISKGHPLGATGLAQCTELCWQLRGLAGKRQVKGAKLALQHNLGLGGAAVITLYRLGFPQHAGSPRIQASPTSSSAVSPEDFQSKTIFDTIEIELKENGADYVKRLKGIYCFKIRDGNKTGVWVVDMKNGNGSVTYDPNGKGEVTLTVLDEDLPKLLMGDLSPQQAFFQGKVKIAGNLGLALKLREFQPIPNAKL